MRLNLKVLQGKVYRDQLNSPVGKLEIVFSDKGLRAVLWPSDLEDIELKRSLESLPRKKSETNVRSQLEKYFTGAIENFSLPLDIIGTEFQKRAWKFLQKIPYGQTFSYSDQASSLGSKNLARAVGAANARNPLSIVVPCHRVIGKNGSTTGFAGGIETKLFLLRLEQQKNQKQRC